ncbi:hypothetical protein [Helicobacter sp. MIT 14-3879]|nr:hypothetical protein [Helicobacter sp. MIT 14-3879]
MGRLSLQNKIIGYENINSSRISPTSWCGKSEKKEAAASADLKLEADK